MAKRGRKPSGKRTGYFYEQEEQAVVDYQNAETLEEKDKIYNTYLRYPFEKMVESIIRRYKLYVPDESFEDTFCDTLSHLMTKIDKYKPVILEYAESKNPTMEEQDYAVEMFEDEFKDLCDKDLDEDDPDFVRVEMFDGTIKYNKKIEKKYKAFSYLGTVCKNYLYGRIEDYGKALERNPSYEPVLEDINNNIRYTDVPDRGAEVANETIAKLLIRVKEMVSNPKENDLRENEVKFGKALITLLENWEYVLSTDGSNKLRKNAILLYLREATGLDTKGVRDSKKKFIKEYLLLKNSVIS